MYKLKFILQMSIFLICTQIATLGQIPEVHYAASDSLMTQIFGKTVKFDTLHKGLVSVKITPENFEKLEPYFKHDLEIAYNQITAGSKIRKIMEQIHLLSEEKVKIEFILVDDSEGLEPDEYSSLYTNIKKIRGDGKKLAAWPSFGNDDNGENSDPEKKFHSWVYIGSESIELNGWGNTLNMGDLILNMAVRTQFIGNDDHWSYAFKPNHGYTYRKFLPLESPLKSQTTAFEEGLATFFSSIYYSPVDRKISDFWESNHAKYVIDTKAPFLEDGNWIPPKKKPVQLGKRKVYLLKWEEMKGEKLLHNPSTVAGFFRYFYHQFHDRDKALELIVKACSKVWREPKKRNLIFVANEMSLLLEEYAESPDGIKAAKAGELISSMWPPVVLDWLTHNDIDAKSMLWLLEQSNPETRSVAFEMYIKELRDDFVGLYPAESYIQKDKIDIETWFENMTLKNPHEILKSSDKDLIHDQ